MRTSSSAPNSRPRKYKLSGHLGRLSSPGADVSPQWPHPVTFCPVCVLSRIWGQLTVRRDADIESNRCELRESDALFALAPAGRYPQLSVSALSLGRELVHRWAMLIQPENIILSGSGARRLRAAQLRSHTRIYLHAFVETESLAPGRDPWIIAPRVAQARILAVNLIMPPTARDPKVFVRESSLIAHGIKTVDGSPPVVRRVRSGSRKPLFLPTVKVGDVEIPASVVRTSRLNVGERASAPVVRSDRARDLAVPGLSADSTLEAAVDIARTNPPWTAIVDVSSVLRHESKFTRWDLGPSRLRAERLRTHLLRINSDMPTSWNRKKADRILMAADAGAESPGEARLRGMVLAALSGGPDADIAVVSQFVVGSAWGQYFLDLAIPSRRIAIEFDGITKLLPNSTDLRAKIRDEKAREDRIRSFGWSFIRFTSDELLRPDTAMAKLINELSRLGLVADVPPCAWI